MEAREQQRSEEQDVSTEENEVQQFRTKLQNQAVEIKTLQKQLQAKDETIKKLIVQRHFAEADAERAQENLRDKEQQIAKQTLVAYDQNRIEFLKQQISELR